MFNRFLSILPWSGHATDWASLILRLYAGGFMAYLHGWSKYQAFAEKSVDWPDPFGVGSAASLSLTIFAELVCAALVAVGFLTRWALVPLFVLAAVLIFKIHWNDAFPDKEHAFAFTLPYIAIFLLGSGRFSVDGLLFKKQA